MTVYGSGDSTVLQGFLTCLQAQSGRRFVLTGASPTNMLEVSVVGVPSWRAGHILYLGISAIVGVHVHHSLHHLFTNHKLAAMTNHHATFCDRYQ